MLLWVSVSPICNRGPQGQLTALSLFNSRVVFFLNWSCGQRAAAAAGDRLEDTGGQEAIRRGALASLLCLRRGRFVTLKRQWLSGG
jgi:hypothetical protein